MWLLTWGDDLVGAAGSNQRPLLCERNGMTLNGPIGRDVGERKGPLSRGFVSGVPLGPTDTGTLGALTAPLAAPAAWLRSGAERQLRIASRGLRKYLSKPEIVVRTGFQHPRRNLRTDQLHLVFGRLAEVRE